MQNTIHIKPHHFVDIITKLGAGTVPSEPHPYGHAVHTAAAMLLGDPETLLVMDLGADFICAPCIHNIDGLCDDTIDTSYRPEAPPSKREWNLLIDHRWCNRLGIKEGSRLTARRLSEIIRDRMGDITDIYREIPAAKTAERALKLRKGIEKYLQK